MEDQRKGNYVITSEALEDVMEESMHILWEFIKADRAEAPTSVLKGLTSAHVELQDPMDHDLMMHIHATLQKVRLYFTQYHPASGKDMNCYSTVKLLAPVA